MHPLTPPALRMQGDGTDLLTADEVASRLKVRSSWVKKAALANRIPHVRVGRYRRFRWPDIEAWLESQRSDA
jgi:excisionase family DNA binding protein